MHSHTYVAFFWEITVLQLAFSTQHCHASIFPCHSTKKLEASFFDTSAKVCVQAKQGYHGFSQNAVLGGPVRSRMQGSLVSACYELISSS